MSRTSFRVAAALLALLPAVFAAGWTERRAVAGRERGAAASGAGQSRPAGPEALAPVYREWLDLTSLIMTGKERDVFLALTNDRERDVFIEAFWRIRDPTPGTPGNEFKDEHLRRFAEADRRYGRGAARPGWKTDRGRMHIILGPPASIEPIAGSSELVPTELWSYYGDPAKGLPEHFVLVFYQRGGGGDYRLYDPVQDGPGRLLLRSASQFDAADYQAMYERIYDLQPSLALVSLSIIPGQIPYRYQPSLETQAQMAAIAESPRRAVNDTYATHFLSYRGVVSTEYLTNVLEGPTEAAVLFDPRNGLPYVHFALAPRRLSLDYFKDKDEYYCDFQIDVSLRVGNKVVLQYAKDIPIHLPADKLGEAESKGVVLEDAFPVIEGASKLTVLFRNTAGKEFAVLEKDLDVPVGTARLAGPVLGYKSAAGRADAFLPFQAGEIRLHIDPKRTYGAGDEILILVQAVGVGQELWAGGSVRASVRGLRPEGPVRREWTRPLKDQARQAVQSLVLSLPASELTPDYYELSLALVDGSGAERDSKKAQLIVTADGGISRPAAYARTLPRAGEFLHFYALAGQYAKAGAGDRAAAYYAKAYSLNPTYAAAIPEYASFLVDRGESELALTVIDRVKDEAPLRLRYFHVRGRALMALGRLDEAATALESGNRVFDSDTALLGDLGRCYARLGRVREALTVLKASLKLDPAQPEIQALVGELAKKSDKLGNPWGNAPTSIPHL